MRKLVIGMLAFFAISVTVAAQGVYTREFGKTTAVEVVESDKLSEKNPDAVVLHSMGKYWFSLEDEVNIRRMYFYREVTQKVKILSEAGLDDYGHYAFHVYTGDRVNVEGFSYTIGTNGGMTKTPITQANIVDEKVEDGLNIRRIAFPNVQVGSIVEIKYRQRTHYFRMPAWVFQQEVPVLYSELEYTAPIYYNYSYLLKGAPKFHVNEQRTVSVNSNAAGYDSSSVEEIIYKFGMNNLPAFEDVDFLPTTTDYMVAVYFQLESGINLNGGSVTTYITTWPNMATDFDSDSDFGKYVNAAERAAKKILSGIKLEGLDETGKIKAISDYVKSMYKWNGSRAKYTSQKAADLIKNKTGNSADINLFLVGLLRAAGIKADPVLLSTSDNGRIYKKYPFSIFFNYTVGMAAVNNKNYFLDATNVFAPFDELPLWCANVEGLVVIPKTEKWVVLAQPQTSVEEFELSINPAPEKGIAAVSAKKSYKGYPATTRRRSYNNSEENLEDMGALGRDETIISAEVENYSDTDKPFVLNYEYEIPMVAADGKIFIEPFSGFTPTKNPFNQKLRTWPVYLYYKSFDSYKASIEIPAGYEVEYLPAAKSVDNSVGTLVYNVEHDGGTIVVNASLMLKKADYSALEYNTLKKLYGDMISTFSENIVLRRI